MNPQNPPSGHKTRIGNELSVMQPGEEVIAVIKRHPIGIIGIYVAITFVLTLAALLAFAVLPGMTNGNEGMQVGAVIFLILASLAFVYALVATKVYWGNNWIVTSDSITQVNQISLFGRQSSQLSLENLEDVTAEQNGIFAHIFNYGVLKAETAGERSKFSFPYCPNPNFYAQKILHSRELFAQQGGHAGSGAQQLPPQQHGINTQSEPVTNPEPPQYPNNSGFNNSL